MDLLVAGISMIVTGGATWYGVTSLTGNNNAGFALGLAFGWLTYQVVLTLNKIADKK